MRSPRDVPVFKGNGFMVFMEMDVESDPNGHYWFTPQQIDALKDARAKAQQAFEPPLITHGASR